MNDEPDDFERGAIAAADEFKKNLFYHYPALRADVLGVMAANAVSMAMNHELQERMAELQELMTTKEELDGRR